jgi:hypothetical protein
MKNTEDVSPIYNADAISVCQQFSDCNSEAPSRPSNWQVLTLRKGAVAEDFEWFLRNGKCRFAVEWFHEEEASKPQLEKELNMSSNESATRERAYHKWQAAGEPVGEDLRFWLEAEREQDGEMSADDQIDAASEDSFPASDPPAGPVTKVGSIRKTTQALRKS